MNDFWENIKLKRNTQKAFELLTRKDVQSKLSRQN